MDRVSQEIPGLYDRLLDWVTHSRRAKRRDVHFADRVFYYSLKTSSWMLVAVLVVMLLVVFDMSWPAFKHFGWRFFITNEWNSVTGEFGALALVYGTVVSSLMALLLAVPVSIGVALFLNELAPRWLSVPLGFFVEMLAAIPSIVYGLWGLFILAPFLRTYIQPPLVNSFGFIPFFEGPPLGVGMMAAGVILAIMIMPTITAICREVFRTIPRANREAALGLGATRWEMLQLAVIRSSQAGILGATILGLGRALGETMAVTMVIGNNPDIRASIMAAAQTMASVLANQYAEADSDLHLSALTAVGFTLFIVSIGINGLARFVVWRVNRKFQGAY
ncbi:MAG: phosphate ABC transporter permease subunit PstC [Bdellovibrionales bacterium]|nr:phosphate ABC transporter permease subunit PstC [Bdellovibrionales bacterium]